MEIVCAPETYRRFESSSLRQQKCTHFWVLFCLITRIEEDSRGEPRTRVSVLPLIVNNRPTLRQNKRLVIVWRGAPLKVRILFSAPKNIKNRANKVRPYEILLFRIVTSFIVTLRI